MKLPLKAAFGTMHDKALAVAPPFAQIGVSLVVPEALDTDAFGTFTGEVARVGSMLDAARAKASAASNATGLPVSLGSEGAFGPHPDVPLMAIGREVLLWRDNETGQEIFESLVDEAPHFGSVEVSSMEEAEAIMRRVQFPATALVVEPVEALTPLLRKGITTFAELAATVTAAVQLSGVGKARVQTDMRAHKNVRRMIQIGRLAHKLATRISSQCPACQSPGWGVMNVETGLPCRACGSATPMVSAEVYSCGSCGFQESHPRSDGLRTADPAMCCFCNP